MAILRFCTILGFMEAQLLMRVETPLVVKRLNGDDELKWGTNSQKSKKQIKAVESETRFETILFKVPLNI